MSEYPPLESVRDREVHSDALHPLQQWACVAYSADGTVDRVRYDWRCLSCVEAAEARIKQDGDQTVWWSYRAGQPSVVVALSWLVSRARTIEDETVAALYPDGL